MQNLPTFLDINILSSTCNASEASLNAFVTILKKDMNPVYKAFVETRVSKTFSKDEVRNTVMSGYMGLIKQIDDNLGRLFKFLDKKGNEIS